MNYPLVIFFCCFPKERYRHKGTVSSSNLVIRIRLWYPSPRSGRIHGSLAVSTDKTRCCVALPLPLCYAAQGARSSNPHRRCPVFSDLLCCLYPQRKATDCATQIKSAPQQRHRIPVLKACLSNRTRLQRPHHHHPRGFPTTSAMSGAVISGLSRLMPLGGPHIRH